jgi:CBS-domain-containing membrane protein
MTEYYYRYHESIYPVVQYSSVQGVVTKQNIRKIPSSMWKYYTVREIADTLSEDNATAQNTDVVEILKKITDRPDHNLVVVKGEKLEGVLTLEDLLPYFSLKISFSPLKSARYFVRKENFPKEGKSKPERVHFFPEDKS